LIKSVAKVNGGREKGGRSVRSDPTFDDEGGGGGGLGGGTREVKGLWQGCCRNVETLLKVRGRERE